MIERQKEKYGWGFLFLGANIDSVEMGAKIGIDRDFTVDYRSDSVGTTLNYAVMSEAISQVGDAFGMPYETGRRGEYKVCMCGKSHRFFCCGKC